MATGCVSAAGLRQNPQQRRSIPRHAWTFSFFSPYFLRATRPIRALTRPSCPGSTAPRRGPLMHDLWPSVLVWVVECRRLWAPDFRILSLWPMQPPPALLISLHAATIWFSLSVPPHLHRRQEMLHVANVYVHFVNITVSIGCCPTAGPPTWQPPTPPSPYVMSDDVTLPLLLCVCIRCSPSLFTVMAATAAEDRLPGLYSTCWIKPPNVYIKKIYVFHFIGVIVRTRNLQHVFIVFITQRGQEYMF